ncbi:MAG: hypothetical protein ACI30K_01885 [Muribaculaceae bacterium]
MEEYRSGKLAPTRRSGITAARHHSGTISLTLAARCIVVATRSAATTAAVVHAFRRGDCKVSFSDSDLRRGTRLAQDSGARYYGDRDIAAIAADMHGRGESIDMVICDSEAVSDAAAADTSAHIVALAPAHDCYTTAPSGKASVTTLCGGSDDAIARMCLIAAAEGYEFIRGKCYDLSRSQSDVCDR